MNIYDAIEFEEERQLPPPPRVPKEHRPTQPTQTNDNWYLNALGVMYCRIHGNSWAGFDANGCSTCLSERTAAALKGTPSHHSPDMRTGTIGNEVRVTDPKTGGQKGSKPERFDLLPWDALEEVARVYAFGATKYDDNNWTKGYKYSLSTAALVRHVSKFIQGQDIDEESGLHHLAHAVFHCLTLIAFGYRQRGTDDRWRNDLEG